MILSFIEIFKFLLRYRQDFLFEKHNYDFSLQKKFEGTRVTVENFLLWKIKFDAAVLEQDKKKSQTDPFSKKLSGRSNLYICLRDFPVICVTDSIRSGLP